MIKYIIEIIRYVIKYDIIYFSGSGMSATMAYLQWQTPNRLNCDFGLFLSLSRRHTLHNLERIRPLCLYSV